MKGGFLYLAFLTLVFLCAACGGSKHITGVTLSAASASVVAGRSTAVTVTVAYGNHTTLTNPAGVTFTSSDTTIATAGADGSVRTLKPGTATITATYLGKTGSITITVTSAVIDSFSLSQTDISLVKGLTSTITLSGTMSDASAVVESSFASCTWTPPAGVATLSATTGRSNTLTATGVGSGTLSVTCSGVTHSTSITVSAAEITRLTLYPRIPRSMWA